MIDKVFFFFFSLLFSITLLELIFIFYVLFLIILHVYIIIFESFSSKINENY